MIKKITLFTILVLLTSVGFTQVMQISGNVKDTATKANVKNAVVALLTPKDSILKSYTRVKADGSYTLSNVKPGKYILSVSHPNFGEYIDDINITEAQNNIPSIALTTKIKLLEAVIVRSGNPIKIKGDTTVYTADSFKVSANANVEELLKKLPGIQVDKNGEIKAMGEKVEKVLVDGEEFFGDDPGMAVKNLRADAVKEVQVFDKKSEQSEFTGIDDGKTKKTINLKLKEDKKKGYFGKVDIAGGLNNKYGNRYNDNILLSSFKGKRKLTGFLLNGNTGQDRLNWQDEQKFGDNEGMVMDEESGFTYYDGSRGASDEEPYVDAQNGFMTNVNAGAQYSNKFNDGKTSLNFSPKYNEQRYVNTTNQYQQNNVDTTSFNTNSTDVNNVNRNNIKLKTVVDLKLDSANTTLKITASSNFYHTESTVFSNSITNIGTATKSAFANSFDRIIQNNSDKQAYSLNAVLKHKFKKARRTISLNTDWSQINSDGDNILKSNNVAANGASVDIININQQKDFDKQTGKFSSKVTYTEPLSKKFALELGYQFSVNHGANDQTTLNFNPITGKYDGKVDTLSNQFRQNIIENLPSAKINYAHKKFKVNVGAGLNFINFDLKDLSSSIAANRSYTNFAPTANLSYAYKSNHNFSVRYNGNTRQPTINQLQPLRTNNDVFNQYIGNPNLKPSFTNNFSVNHNAYNFIKDLWMYQSLNLGVTNNSIATNRITNKSTGATVSQPINTNGNINLNFYGGMGMKLKKINTRINFNLNGGYNKYVDFINSQKVATNNTNAGISFYAQKSKDKVYDFSMNVGTNYNIQKTTQSNFENKYLTTEFGLDATGYLKKVWSLNASYELNSRQKTAQAPGYTFNILNARLQRTFKKDEFTVYVLAKDLLNQNIGLDRTFGQNASFTETRNDRLQRYWMVGFAWNFKNKATAKK
jgi:hypothetical protein